MNQRILVWDIPTRVFHWLLAVSFMGAFLTAESERYRDIHVMFGYTLLGLIAFRLLWGFIGSRYAQFGSFLFKPAEIAAYLASLLKARPEHHVGHNPAGSVAVFALLALGVACGVTGVILFQDIGGDALEELHEGAAFVMLTVVGVHIVGVLVSSLLHHENLARSMITGLKAARQKDGIRHAHAWLGVIMLAVVVAFWVGYPAAGVTQPSLMVSQAEHDHDHDDD